MSLRGPVLWKLGEVTELVRETPRVGTLHLKVPEWPGHLAGQHVDVRLTAEDGYQAQRSYSIASAPEDSQLAITVERLDDGEVSPYLVGELKVGDKLELRGPIGGLVAGALSGSGKQVAVLAPAFPEQGRLLSDGTALVDGKPGLSLTAS